MSSDNHRSLHLSPSSSPSNHSTIYEKDDACTAPIHASAETRKSLGSETSSSSTPIGGQRSTRALLTRQTLFTPLGSGSSFDAFGTAGSGNGGLAGNGHSPAQCVHGALMRTASSNFSCPVHGSQAHLCSTEARLLSRANKILMYVLLLPLLIFNFHKTQLTGLHPLTHALNPFLTLPSPPTLSLLVLLNFYIK